MSGWSVSEWSVSESSSGEEMGWLPWYVDDALPHERCNVNVSSKML